MRRGLFLSLVLSGLILIGCERDRGVYAASGEYQPRPAPAEKKTAPPDIHGELMRVNVPKNTLMVRVENGMEQTFKFNNHTVVMGLNTSQAAVRNLVGREGSELIVRWRDDDGGKLADRVDVTQPVTNRRHRR
ncbi:MAG TPA: hypothetical protein VGK48_08220 [Terriglobia bacterium]|jgi:hypothetical protein